MKTFESLDAWRAYRAGREPPGFVPTMGALHDGHLSLVQRCRDENPWSVVSVFVNPTQFNDPSDLENYPRPLKRDLDLLEAADVDAVILPSPAELYPDGYRYRISESDLSRRFCGLHRPGHFDGVLTVVMKLLNLAGAARAYFGEKDFQQLHLIRGLAEAFFLDTRIVGCPIVREPDGLALSSRNLRLDPAQRTHAPRFHRLLASGGTAEHIRGELEREGFEVDYVDEFEGRRLAAVRLGEIRLIDNVPLPAETGE